jgi:hypothetical protein
LKEQAQLVGDPETEYHPLKLLQTACVSAPVQKSTGAPGLEQGLTR